MTDRVRDYQTDAGERGGEKQSGVINNHKEKTTAQLCSDYWNRREVLLYSLRSFH